VIFPTIQRLNNRTGLRWILGEINIIACQILNSGFWAPGFGHISVTFKAHAAILHAKFNLWNAESTHTSGHFGLGCRLVYKVTD